MAADWVKLLPAPTGLDGHETLRLSELGVRCVAEARRRNRRALSAHDVLAERMARELLLAGRLVWRELSLRAQADVADVADVAEGAAASPGDGAQAAGAVAWQLAAPALQAKAPWRMARPDLFSVRNTSVEAYLQPVVHEIKVSRADLLGDLRLRDKRDSYLDIGGQCWYVLGCDARGRPIAQADEVPPACGVIFAMPDGQLDVARHAPSRAIADLPFALWMALSRATPLSMAGVTDEDGGPGQAMLQPQTAPAADLP